MNNDFNNQSPNQNPNQNPNGQQQGNFYNPNGQQQGNFYNPNGQQQGNFYNPNGYQQPFFDPYQQNQAEGMKKAASAKNMGVAALVFSFLSLCLSPLISIILGILAITGASSAKNLLGYETPEIKSARSLGITGIVITAVIYVLCIIVGVIIGLSGALDTLY